MYFQEVYFKKPFIFKKSTRKRQEKKQEKSKKSGMGCIGSYYRILDKIIGNIRTEQAEDSDGPHLTFSSHGSK